MKKLKYTLIITVLSIVLTVVGCKEEVPKGRINLISPTASELSEMNLSPDDSLVITFNFTGESEILVVYTTLILFQKDKPANSDKYNLIYEPIYPMENDQNITLKWKISKERLWPDDRLIESGFDLQKIGYQLEFRSVTTDFSYISTFPLENANLRLN